MILKRIYALFDPEWLGILLFLLVLPFHLVVKQLLPPPWGTYWKEILLGVLVVGWISHSLPGLIRPPRRLQWNLTPLDWAILIYLGLLALRFILDRSGGVGAWGLYISVMYLPLFWVVRSILRRYSKQSPGRGLIGLTALLVAAGGVVALGGLAEFALDRPLWPSEEIVQRQGFSDVFIYGTSIRRVYFTFDSPTTLANTLALLLPLALVLFLLARRLWVRLIASLAVIVISACIIVTFSRGIWVSAVLALLVMGLLASLVTPRLFKFPARQLVWSVGGGVVLFGLGWGLLAGLRPSQVSPSDRGVVELSPAAYESAPITGVAQNFLADQPVFGQAVTQTWSLFDSIDNRDDVRTVLYEHPPESGKVEIIYRSIVPETGALRFGISMSPEVWSPEKGDGANFQIYIAEADKPTEGQFVFVRYINPKYNPSDRRWRNFLVDLSPWAGRTVNLSFITEGGPAGNWLFDWAGWAELQLVSVEQDYFASTQTENAILYHASSTLDWARDETNRDRLAAWGLGLKVWQDKPFWGNGLGSTGVAALRTNPAQAFVTESQMLKALVELGLPGLLVLAYLWFQIARTGYQAYRREDDPARRLLLLGVLTSLLIVFIEGWVYQNLEVKQVNAYFWTLVGMLAFLAEKSHAELHRLSDYS